MIYGNNAGKTTVFGQRVTGSSLSLDLPNGDWSFYAIGWAGANPMEGLVRCATSTAKLDGSPVSVSLVMTNANCSNSLYTLANHNFSGNPQPVRLYSCNDIVGATAGGDCTGSEGVHGSLRIVLPNFLGATPSDTKDPLNALNSSCINVGAGGIADVLSTLPLGSSSFFLGTEIHAFLNTGCTGADKEVYRFPQGLGLGDTNSRSVIFDTAGAPDRTTVFLLSTLPLPTPTGITLSGSAITNSTTYNVTVSGTIAGATVQVYNDSVCTSLLGSNIAPGTTTAVAVSMGADGNYPLYAQQTLGTFSSSCSPLLATLTLDSVTPTVATAYSWGHPLYVNLTAITFNWTPGSDLGSGVSHQRVHLYSDPSCTSFVAVSPNLASGAGTHTFTGLGEGTYYAHIETVDNATNSTATACSSIINIDLTAPSLSTGLNWSDSSPSNFATININWTPSVSGDRFDQTVLVYSDASCGAQIGSFPVGVSDSTYPYTPSEGTFSFRIRSSDFATNFSDSPCSTPMIIDRTAAAPTSIVNTTPATNIGNDSTPTFTVMGLEDGGEAQLFFDAGCSSPASTTFNISGTSVAITADPLSDGVYTFHANQVDLAGNISACSAVSANYTYDSVPPTTPVILGVTGGTDTIIDNLMMDGSVPVIHWTGLASIDYYEIAVFDSTSFATCNYQSISGALTSYSFTGCFVSADETYTIKLRATDLAGNTSAEGEFKFVYSWLSTINLPLARSQFRAVVDGPDSVFLWGGLVGGSPTNTGYHSDFIMLTWVGSEVTNAPSPRRGHALINTGTEKWVWGGDNSGTATNTGGRYNGTWTAITTTGAPVIRTDHAYGWSSTYNKMLIWGGKNGVTSYNNGATFDGTSWMTMSPAGIAGRHFSAFAVVGNFFIVWGGRNNSTSYNDGAIYNIATDTWTAMNTSPISPRFNMAFVATNDELILFGGENHLNTKFNNGARFNPTTNTWQMINPGPLPQIAESMAVVKNDKLYIWGGKVSAGNTPFAGGAIYDLDTNIWNEITLNNSPAGVLQGGFLDIGDQLIMFGGIDEFSNPTTDARRLGPLP